MPAKKKQASLGKTKNTTTYGHGGSTYAPPKKMNMYKRGGSVSGTPKSLPGNPKGSTKFAIEG